MTRICFYTSDYGYGHATRDVAIVRGIHRECGAEFFVKTGNTYEFMKESLPFARAIKRPNDVGICHKGDSAVADEERTGAALDKWTRTWGGYISEEVAFCKENKVDIILSDIVPQAFLVAEELGVPGIGISNFTWHYIFSNLLGHTESTERLAAAYASAHSALVLPFNESMGVFKRRKEIGLVSRKITESRQALRSRHGLSNDVLLVYLGFGKSLGQGFLRSLKRAPATNLHYLVSSGAELPLKNVIQIPPDATETQNYIAMCDLVVAKCGYSTVSEAIQARIPMFLFRRRGYEEDRLIADGVKALGLGKEITEGEFLGFDWVNEVGDLNAYRPAFEKLTGRFKRDGMDEIVEAVKEAAR